jgi:hypothetical protein
MSTEARQYVARNAILQNPLYQNADLTTLHEDGGVDTNVIAVLERLLRAGWYVEITSIRRDHGDDSSCGPDSHHAGMAVDLYPLSSRSAGAWADPFTDLFDGFLKALVSCPEVKNVGLGGDAYSEERLALLGDKGFQDNGSDHIHFQV